MLNVTEEARPDHPLGGYGVGLGDSEKDRRIRELEAEIRRLWGEPGETAKVRSEDAVSIAQQDFVDTVESLEDGFFSLDREWRFIYLNRRAAENVGFAPEELIGKNIWEVFPTILGTAHETAYRKAMEERVSVSVEIWGTLTSKWYRLGASPSSSGIGVVWTDITEQHRLREALREQKEHYRTLFEASPAGILVFAPDGSILEFNERAHTQLGYSREEFSRLSLLDLEVDESPEEIRAHFERNLQAGSARFETRQRTKTGEIREVAVESRVLEVGSKKRLLSVFRDLTERKAHERQLAYLASYAEHNPSPVTEVDAQFRVRFANPAALLLFPRICEEATTHPWLTDWEATVRSLEAGTHPGFREVSVDGPTFYQHLVYLKDPKVVRIYAIDITARVQAEAALRESEERFRAMADGTPLMIWVTDERGVIHFVNRAYCEFFGTSVEEVRSGGWQPLVHPEDHAGYVKAFFESLREQKVFRAQARVRRVDGQWRWVESYGVPRFSSTGEFLGIAGSSPDITEQHCLQEALRTADRRKDEFLATLSHELRNPLAPICNSLYILQRATAGREQANRAAGIIERQVGHLTRLVDDLLDLTRISRGKVQLKLEFLDLGQLGRKIAQDYREMFEGNGIQFDSLIPDEPIWVYADRTRIAQVLCNLLGNSTKFTPQLGRVLFAIETAGSSVTVRVRDSGVGIPADVLPNLFQPFIQAAETLERSRGGLGIGLALVKGLAELHGGSVSVTSDGPGRGAEFLVRLPLVDTSAHQGMEASASILPQAPGYRAGRYKVLIVEDDVDAASSLKELLEMLGHQAQVAFDGPTGIALAKESTPDLLLCDIGLPAMDGYQVARLFREDPELREITLVALSGYALPDDVARAKESGFDQHLAKPPSLEELERVFSFGNSRRK